MRCDLLMFATFSLVSARNPAVTHMAIIDVAVSNKTVGTIEIGLFAKIVPNTVKNFIKVCTRSSNSYKGSQFYPIYRLEMVRVGYIAGVAKAKPLPKENFKLKHYGAGWVSMMDIDGNHNTEFIITLLKHPELDGKHVVFGKVIGGMDMVWMVGNADTLDRRPRQKITINDCTVKVIKKPFTVEKTDAL